MRRAARSWPTTWPTWAPKSALKTAPACASVAICETALKCFQLINVTDSGLPASNLNFLDRNDALRYQKMLLWPFENLGYMPLSDGRKIKLSEVVLKVESRMIPGLYDPALDWVLSHKDGKLGFSAVVPGRCFDPDEWREVSEADRLDPNRAPLLAEAERHLLDNKFD